VRPRAIRRESVEIAPSGPISFSLNSFSVNAAPAIQC
jgi:hypothetical protein